MCDLVGHVRVAGVSGDPWRLSLAAYVSGLSAVTSTRGVPGAAEAYVNTVDGYAAWFAMQPQFGGLAAPSAAAPGDVPASQPIPVPDAQVTAVQAAGENPDARGDHLFVEHVDIAMHRFVFDGGVVVVGMMNGNQILWHDFTCGGLGARRFPSVHCLVERPGWNSTIRR